MSVTTKVACLGLIRDSAPELASQANGLRKAENVVLRSPGVLETRPSFALLHEQDGDRRVRAMHEFNGRLLYVWQDTNDDTWGLSDEDGNDFDIPTVARALAPVDYYASETKFAEARKNLYGCGLQGPWVTSNADPNAAANAGDVRMAGAVNRLQASYGVGGGIGVETVTPATAYAYRLVVKRTDPNGYIRRSPPSARILLTKSLAPYVYGTGAKVEFGTGLIAGDEVEFYRSIATAGLSSPPQHYLAFAYTITAADVALGYFVPPTDTTQETDLGAQLYTDDGQLGATAAKFAPPQAQALAFWQSCMWYGRTKTPSRLILQLVNLYLGGRSLYASNVTSDATRAVTFTAASSTVACANTTGLAVGMPITDAPLYGIAYDGFYVPADSYITAITPNVQFSMNNVAFNSGTTAIAGMPLSPTPGLSAFELGNVATTSGSRTVTLGLDHLTTGMRPGMYFTTNNAASGGAAVASAVPANAKVVEILDGITFTIDQDATGTVSALGFVGDTVTVNGVDFYCWGANTLVDPLSAFTVPWRQLPIGDPGSVGAPSPYASVAIGLTIQNIVTLVNAYYFAHSVADFGVYATPIGDVWDFRDITYDDAGVIVSPGTLATSVAFESDFGDTPITVTSSCPDAFSPSLPQASLDETRPNRLFYSALDEPEAVPLLNYFNIGSEKAPILALVPLRNALLVFKADGLWRVTGSGPDAWTVETLDPTLRLLRPEAVTASQNKAWAWCSGGMMMVDEQSAQSLTAEKIDKELRTFSEYVTSSPYTRGSMVVAVQQRNLVLFGVPASAAADYTSRVYAYCTTTNAWTEWPIVWSHACESASFDTSYCSLIDDPAKPGKLAIDIEIRKMTPNYRGYDRTFDMGPAFSISGLIVTVTTDSMGTWRPEVGDWISALGDGVRVYRRITDTSYDAGSDTWTFTLEAVIDETTGLLVTDTGVFFVDQAGVFFEIATLSAWQGHEAIELVVEWQPTAPSGLPVGAVCREMQFQMDLTQWPSETEEESIPEYVVGASSERDTSPYTVTSHHARTRTVQPLRVGTSRQVARSALIAPYFQTSDIFAFRLVGASLIHEGTSEKTRR